MAVDIRRVGGTEREAHLRLRRVLWDSEPEVVHFDEMAEFLEGPGPGAAFLAFAAEGRAVGLLEVSVRYYADGCATRTEAACEADDGMYGGDGTACEIDGEYYESNPNADIPDGDPVGITAH